MPPVVLQISGMHCSHCVGKVETALRGVDGVEHVAVLLEEGEAEVDVAAGTAAEPLVAAVAAAGYSASVKPA